MVEIPDRLCVDTVEELINYCFPPATLADPLANFKDISENAILSPRNVDVNAINQQILDRLPGEERVYTSEDTVGDTGPLGSLLPGAINNSMLENIWAQTPDNLPPHFLRLKVGAVVILTRNMNLAYGLCNGTRLQVVQLGNYGVRCRILTGPSRHVGKKIWLGRAKYQHGTKKSFRGTPFTRNQLPIRLAFAMTINKAQGTLALYSLNNDNLYYSGQTLNRMGLALHSQQVFSHGHLYVAFSRIRTMENIRVCSNHGDNTPRNHLINVVYEEVLDRPDAVVVSDQQQPPPPPPPRPSPPQSLPRSSDEEELDIGKHYSHICN